MSDDGDEDRPDEDDDRPDPFAEFGDDDREGDPFENLDRPEPDDADERDEGDDDRLERFWDTVEEESMGNSAVSEGDAAEWDDPTDATTGEARGQDAVDADATTSEATDVDVTTGEATAADATTAEASTPDGFGGQDVPDPTVEDPFDDMGDDEREGDPFSADSAFERVDVGSVDPDDVWAAMDEDGDTDEDPVPEESRYAEVSKHSYCEQCEHFSEPPDATCTHETAELVEFLDMETVRLLNCPVVAERRQIEREN